MKTKYEDTLFYQINSCAKCFNMLFDQYFNKLNLGLSAVEHLALGIIIDINDCCQRDLARTILKDRANTGKLVANLEKKGLIKVNLKTKNNRPAKILTATKKGIELWTKAYNMVLPTIEKIKKEISQDEIKNTINMLRNFRKIVENTVKVNI